MTKKLQYKDVYYTLAKTNTSRTVEIATALPTGAIPVSLSWVQNDALYYMTVVDGIIPNISIKPNGAIQFIGMNKIPTPADNRVFGIRVAYTIP